MTIPEKPCTRADLVFRQLDEEWVVYDPRDEQLHVLNLAAALVWTHCDGHHTQEEIVAAVQAAFEGRGEPAGIAHDVAQAISRFAELGLFGE